MWVGVWDDADRGGGGGEMGRAYRDHAADSQADCGSGLLATNYTPPTGTANLGNQTPFRSLELELGRRGQIRPNPAP